MEKSRNKRLTNFDILAMIIVTLIYSIVSFINLGDADLPKTQPDMGNGEKKNI